MPYILPSTPSPTVVVQHGSLSRTTAFYESPPLSASREINSSAVSSPMGSAINNQRHILNATGGEVAATGPTPSSTPHPWSNIALEREEELDHSTVNNSHVDTHIPVKEDIRLANIPEAVAVPPAAATISSVSNVVAAVSATAHENLVQWSRPVRPVVFRDWYISRYCNEQQVRWIEKMQHVLRPIEPLLIRYFQLWSLTGEAEFYTLFIPTVVWIGIPLDGMQIASLLWLGQYVTGTLKDSVRCPRPPCPPLQLRGKRFTHDNEYGFPSTHSSHSGVFSYFLYCELLRLFPTHAFLCWLAALFFFANVSFSRIYLGMHWIGDLIGGWMVAFLSVLFHVAFLDQWEASLLCWSNPPWWAFLLLYIAFHILSMAHATPHDPCPCYMDSMRFTGVMVGAYLGFWCFYSFYGTLSARQRPENIWDVLCSWDFLVQWTACMIIMLACKELASAIAGVVLKVMFKALAGVYLTKAPQPLRNAYLAVVNVIGLTTRGNEKGTRRYIPFTVNNSFSFMRDGRFGGGAGNGGPTAGATVPNPMRGETAPVEEPDGYLNNQQVWSLRTHRHWWLWDIHKRSISYTVTGFVISFVCQVVLRELFEVGKTTRLVGPTVTPTWA
ncbi:putative sphingosine-1-phosphate phosphatase [Leptomonas seymouri]|uniref:Putative sphingosine-1-phosphate phosphatase n=1 Tax=Leptomonas seymouri TaxID=5684 RepID=A0A0N1P9L1_LEPSE|nr:putative sphingosine-1-phosphate phosphatase [Leptomonas seymouri]|eukprot:KPI83680.1 putative sphingosine-1-phosphate phosphatase [Leptomonas seymouri]